MATSYFPFDGVPVNEAEWRKMAQHWLPTGVIDNELNELAVFADSTGMQVKVPSGRAWIKGHYFESDAQETLAIGAADATNPRIDRVIVKADFTANTIVLAVLAGTAAASPVAPALTQSATVWEISLAQVRVEAGVSTIAAGKVTDERTLVSNVTVPGVGDLLDFQYIRKSADESVTSSTVLQDDDHLTQAIGANQTWLLDLWLYYVGASAGDLQLAITCTGAGGRFGVSGLVSTATATSGDATMLTRTLGSSVAVSAVPLSGNVAPFVYVSAIVTNGGSSSTAKLQWAQDVSNATATTILSDSYMVARRVA